MTPSPSHRSFVFYATRKALRVPPRPIQTLLPITADRMASKNAAAVNYVPTLSLYAAQLATSAATGKAKSLGVSMNIAVVDK